MKHAPDSPMPNGVYKNEESHLLSSDFTEAELREIIADNMGLLADDIILIDY